MCGRWANVAETTAPAFFGRCVCKGACAYESVLTLRLHTCTALAPETHTETR